MVLRLHAISTVKARKLRFDGRSPTACARRLTVRLNGLPASWPSDFTIRSPASCASSSPPQPDGVFRFYNCGPTVYAPAHIGNFRTFVVNDVLRRLLELEFGPDKVQARPQPDRRRRQDHRPAARGRPAAGRGHQAVDRQVPRRLRRAQLPAARTSSPPPPATSASRST